MAAPYTAIENHTTIAQNIMLIIQPSLHTILTIEQFGNSETILEKSVLLVVRKFLYDTNSILNDNNFPISQYNRNIFIVKALLQLHKLMLSCVRVRNTFYLTNQFKQKNFFKAEHHLQYSLKISFFFNVSVIMTNRF